MTVFVALLRASNVGGSSVLPMTELRTLCEALGFGQVRTYIQSGNVIFESDKPEAVIKSVLESALTERMSRTSNVVLRRAVELAEALAANPFAAAAGNRVQVVFLDTPPAADLLEDLVIPGREEVRLAGREVFVHYPDGIGRSKLKLGFAAAGTARNVNTVKKLAELAGKQGVGPGIGRA